MSTRGVGLLLRRELARLDRSPGRRRLVRGATVLGLASVLLIARDTGSPLAPFLSLAWAQLILICFLQPVRAAGIFVEGRLDGTLPLLALTPLQPWAIAFGSCLAALALAAEGLLISLPLFAISAVHADLATLDLLRVAATLLAAALLTTSIGAAVGAKGSARGAVSNAFMRSLAWVALLWFSTGFLFSIGESMRNPAGAAVIRPIASALFLPSGLLLDLSQGWAAPLTAALMSLVPFGLTVSRTANSIRDEEQALAPTPSQADPIPTFRAAFPALGPRAPRAPRVVPETEAVAWRESLRAGASGCFRPGWCAIAFLVFTFGSGVLGMVQSRQWSGAVYMLVLLGCLLWLLVVAWGLMWGARAYVEDREEGTLELLLTTPRYTPERLVREKLRGAIERGRYGIIAGALVQGVGLVGSGVLREASPLVLCLTFLTTLLVWLAGARFSLALGQVFSLRAPSSARAQTWAAATAGVCFFLGAFVSCFLTPLWVMPSVGTAGWVPAVTQASFGLLLLGFEFVLAGLLRTGLARQGAP